MNLGPRSDLRQVSRSFRTTELFPGREEQALEAAEIIERIRTDELIHVESLRLYLGELRSLTLRREDGGTIPGSEIVDRFWQNLIAWSVGEQPKLVATQTHASIAEMIDERSAVTGIRERFDELRDEGYELAAA